MDAGETVKRSGAESAGQRFGRELRAFRQRNLPNDLITHERIHALGGPTRNVQSRIESGQVDTISATTEAKYNTALEALGLPSRSATAVLHGGGTLHAQSDERDGVMVPHDDVESGVSALQNLARKHRSVVDLVTELDRLGIELKRARSHIEGYQLVFPKQAIDRLLEALKNVAEPTPTDLEPVRRDQPEI